MKCLRTATIFNLNNFLQLKSSSARLIAALVLFFAVGARAETTNALSDAEIQGRQLARQLCDARPAENFTNTGVLQIRDGQDNRTNFSIKCEVVVTPANWQSIYETVATNKYLNGSRLPYLDVNRLQIIHTENQPDEYRWHWQHNNALSLNEEEELRKSALLESSSPSGVKTPTLSKEELKEVKMPETYLVGGSFGDFRVTRGGEKWLGTEFIHSFSQSDFWAVDLGLEFFHWPAQKVLPKTTNLKRGRDYTLLESTNPNPATNGYSRVLTWIDKETGGILEAEAYDFNGKLLKDFAPKSFKKVNGQWELQEMEIRNVQTGSRTRLEFDSKK